MKKIASILLMGVSLVGCNAIDGTLNVQHSFQMVNKKRDVVTIPAGSFHSKLKYSPRDREMEIKIKGASRQSQTLVVKVPSHVAVPETSGTFYVRGYEVSQRFDMGGSVNTNVNTTGPYSGWESCSYTTTEWQCVNGNCHNVTVSRTGQQQVRYREQTTTKSVQIAFSEPSSGGQYATFFGQDTNSDRIYEYKGRCLAR
jgi:hypothetical protein